MYLNVAILSGTEEAVQKKWLINALQYLLRYPLDHPVLKGADSKWSSSASITFLWNEDLLYRARPVRQCLQ